MSLNVEIKKITDVYEKKKERYDELQVKIDEIREKKYQLTLKKNLEEAYEEFDKLNQLIQSYKQEQVILKYKIEGLNEARDILFSLY
jgi:phage shock protein A